MCAQSKSLNPHAIPVVQGLFVLVRGLKAFINLGAGKGKGAVAKSMPRSCPTLAQRPYLGPAPTPDPLLTLP